MRKCKNCGCQITHNFKGGKYNLFHVYQNIKGGIWFYNKHNKNKTCLDPKE